MIFKQEKDYTIINDDMLKMGEYISNGSIDAIICDPPYELGFMGKRWDATGIAYNPDAWRKCFDALKNGGYLLAFGGTRTFHRIACAIEDAGFEIRDTIMWLYGSGFPKSHNVGLDIDKKLGCPNRGHRIATANRYHPDGTYEPNGEKLEPYKAKTEAGGKWEGWGTALKPAYEPIIVARKPFKGSVADNILKNGVGGINIDECRVGDEEIGGGTSQDFKDVGEKQKEIGEPNKISFGQIRNAKRIECQSHIGRFPSNVIHDGSDEAIAGMPIGKQNGSITAIYKPSNCIYGKYESIETFEAYQDSGSASRYFYCAKANNKDRDGGMGISEETPTHNIHPTVKPAELMQYLIRLVSPKGATILDCFMGSGSTGKAVMFENRERDASYKFVGIEMSEAYCEIAASRIDYALNEYEYDEKIEREKTGQLSLFDYGDEKNHG